MIMNKNKIAVVTGGNKGIGLSITKKLLDNNYCVIVGARSSIDESNTDPNLIFVQGDVSNLAFHYELMNKSLLNFGIPNLYVNNAGFSEWKSIKDITEEFLDNIFSTNLYGAFWGCKVASEKMEKGSSIINISSIAGKRGSSNNSAYVSTKFGMNGLTQSLSKELGPNGIRVNALCPVLIKTNGLVKALEQKNAPGNNSVDDFLNDFSISQTALKRLPTAEEVAEMVLFLASDKASAITGQCINVDCGVFPQ